jgi:hypothetical protein
VYPQLLPVTLKAWTTPVPVVLGTPEAQAMPISRVVGMALVKVWAKLPVQVVPLVE